MEVNKPRSGQSSRKGKKSWRKNVDIDDIEIGLHENREKKRLLGDDITDDFIIETTGDEKLRGKTNKVLKSREILTNKSKILPLEVERNNKKGIQGVKSREVHRLMKLSGRVKGESKLHARVEKDGIIKAGNIDVWAEETVDKKPEILKKFSDKEVTKATRVPETLKHAPIRISEAEKVVDAGKSYNPSLESWKGLINKEFGGEYERELQRQAIADHQEQIKQLIATIDENEEQSDSEDDQDLAEEDESSAIDDYKLSINKPTQVKIKTKTKRNRELKHKKRTELEAKLADLKRQVKELEKLDVINSEVTEKLSNTRTKTQKAPKKLFKYNSVQKPLEVKLSDELTNNLKNLKPEGNLFYDQMLNLQSSGKIETRIPVAKRRKYTPKITEKWTYKDFK